MDSHGALSPKAPIAFVATELLPFRYRFLLKLEADFVQPSRVVVLCIVDTQQLVCEELLPTGLAGRHYRGTYKLMHSKLCALYEYLFTIFTSILHSFVFLLRITSRFMTSPSQSNCFYAPSPGGMLIGS